MKQLIEELRERINALVEISKEKSNIITQLLLENAELKKKQPCRCTPQSHCKGRYFSPGDMLDDE